MAENVVQIMVQSVDESTAVFDDISAQAEQTFNQAEQSAQGLNETIEQQPVSGASQAMENTQTAAGETEGAIDDAGQSAASFSDKLKSGLGKANEHWKGLATSAGVLGGSIEGLARQQGELTETTEKVAHSTGLEADEIRNAASEAAGAHTDHEELTNIMKNGAEQGLESADALQEYSSNWEKIGSATGENAEKLAESSVALERVGISAGEEGKAMEAFGFITEDTTQEIGDMMDFIDRSGDEIEDLGLDLDDTAALMGALEEETGATGRTARQDLRQAMNETDGSMEELLDTLGVSEDAFEGQRKQVKESGDVIDNYNDINEENATVMEEITQKAQNFMSKHGELIQTMSQLAPIMIALVPAIKGVMAAFKGARAAAMLFNTTLLANPITWIVAAIAGLVAAIVLIWKNWDEVSQFLSDSWDWIKEKASTIFGAIGDAIADAWQWIVDKTKAIWNGIKDFFVEYWDVLLSIIGGPIGALITLIIKNWDKIKETTMQVFNSIKEFFVNFWQGTKQVFTTTVQAVKTAVQTAWNWIKNTTSTIFNGIKNVIQTVWNGIKTAVTTTVNAVKNTISTVFNAIKSTITTIWNTIKSVSQSTWDGIKAAVTAVIDALSSAISSTFNAIKSTVTSIFNGIKSVASSVWNGIKNAVTSAINTAKSIVTSVVSGIKSTVTGIFNDIKNVTSDIWNGLKNIVSDAIGGLKDAASNLAQAGIDAIKNAWSNLASIGKDLVKGLWNGIGDMTGWIKDKISGFAGDVLGGLKDFFGISSPSDETDWMGEMLGEGLGGGIDKKIPAVLAKAKEMADAALPNVDDADIPDILGGKGTTPEIKDEDGDGDSIRRILEKIADLLSGDDDDASDGTPVEIPIMLNRREVGRAMSDDIDNILRDKTSSATRAKGR